MSRWGPEGPPPEAYSRVTEPERFAPLHEFADQLIIRLAERFDVDAGKVIDADLEHGGIARASIRLVPRSEDAAPITFTFTPFPGLRARFGHWYTEAFPSCGCDACDENAEDLTHRLGALVEDVTAGRFREASPRPAVGDEWYSEASGSGWSGGTHVARARAEQALEVTNGETSFEWAPWPQRST
jgi:hypothetical protein